MIAHQTRRCFYNVAPIGMTSRPPARNLISDYVVSDSDLQWKMTAFAKKLKKDTQANPICGDDKTISDFAFRI